MRTIFGRGSVLAVCLVTLGCGHVTKLHQTPKGLLLSHSPGMRLDMTFLSAELGQISGHTVEVRVLPPAKTIDPATAQIKQIKPNEWGIWRENFQQALADTLFRSRIFKDVSTPNDAKPIIHPDLCFDFAITEWNEGTGWKRYFIGFGAGATRMQWEGALLDVRAKRILFAFADKRLHPGGPSMLSFNLKPFHGGALIKEDLRWGMQDLVETLRKQTKTSEKIDKKATRPVTHQASPAGKPIRYMAPPAKKKN